MLDKRSTYRKSGIWSYGMQFLAPVSCPMGHTVDNGHGFLHLGVNIWEPDVFAFLDENMLK